MKQQAARLAKINGFKSLKEMARYRGCHTSTLSRMYRRDPIEFMDEVVAAKELKRAKDDN